LLLIETNDLYTWGWNESGQTGFPAPKNTFTTSTRIQKKSHQIANLQKSEMASESHEACNDPQCDRSSFRGKKSASSEDDGNSESPSFKSDVHKSEFESVGVITSPQLLELERYLAVEENEFVSIIDVACGSRHTVAVTSLGQVLSWGWGKYGQLGQACCSSNDVTTGNSSKNTCKGVPHLPNLVKFDDGSVFIKNVKCGPWNTFLFGSDSKIS